MWKNAKQKASLSDEVTKATQTVSELIRGGYLMRVLEDLLGMYNLQPLLNEGWEGRLKEERKRREREERY